MLLHHSHQHLHLHVPSRYVQAVDGMDYLILADFYSKVILVHNLPAGQSNSAKVIHILEEWFCDHGTPEVLNTDNGPHYASAAFPDCSIELSFTNETSSPHYPQSNGFAESCIKIVNNTLQHAKYSGTNPRIILQHLKATLVDAKLQEHLEDQADHAKFYADKHSKQLTPFYAGEPIATFDTLRKIWIPATGGLSFPRTATKDTLQMEPSATIPDAISGNTVSNAMMLNLRPHQLHQPHQPYWNRLTQGSPDLCHSLP